MTDRSPVLVLDVGQCNPDHRAICSLLESLGVRVLRAATGEEAFKILEKEAITLVLVNRVFHSDGSDGITWIRKLSQRDSAPPAMLVSNYDWAQEEAVSAGAVPGFGKSALTSQKTRDVLQRNLAPAFAAASPDAS